MEPTIRLNGVSKIFHTADDEKVAVAPLTLTIQHGERLGIVGPNGAGKSTLLHMIAGLSSPTFGSLDIEGKVTCVMTLGVGMRENVTGRENIYIDGELQGKSRFEIDKVIDQIIEFAELGEFIDLEVRTYSTGMKARLSFSMISHIDPEILIIDEALSVGDAAFSVKATARIKEICARGKIVIIVSHGMQAIKEICNRCLWLESGSLVMDGSPEEVTRAYIDSVRGADEAQLKIKFKKLIGFRSTVPGWSITQVDLYCDYSDIKRSSLEAGQPARIEIRGIIPLEETGASLRARIVRLDNLLVFDEIFLVGNFRLRDQSIGLRIQMEMLILGTAIYRIDISLQNEKFVCAEGSSIFEVFTNIPPTGGKPMLLLPLLASSTAATL